MEKQTVDHSSAPLGQIMSVFPEYALSGKSWLSDEPLLRGSQSWKGFIYLCWPWLCLNDDRYKSLSALEWVPHELVVTPKSRNSAIVGYDYFVWEIECLKKTQNFKCSEVCHLLLLFISVFNTSGPQPNCLFLGKCGFSFLGECAFYKFF